MLRFLVRGLSPHHPDVLRSFRRRSPEDPAACSSAPPGSHAAPPAPGISARGKRRKQDGTCRGAAPLSGAFGVAAPQTLLQAPWLTGAPSSAPPTPPATGRNAV